MPIVENNGSFYWTTNTGSVIASTTSMVTAQTWIKAIDAATPDLKDMVKPPPKFKIGDKVKVLRSVNDFRPHHDCVIHSKVTRKVRSWSGPDFWSHAYLVSYDLSRGYTWESEEPLEGRFTDTKNFLWHIREEDLELHVFDDGLDNWL